MEAVSSVRFDVPALLARGSWRSFRPGIEIQRLYGDPAVGNASALLRYQPGASLPRHEHLGHEWIWVLAGSQRDERGEYSAGTLVVNTPGSKHALDSHGGCIVLITWEAPVRFDSSS
jgi:anti-sigma factor ChrR (cupin superfamily)